MLLLLSACGWHLRGAAKLPPAMALTYIDTTAKTSTLTLYLNRSLRAAGVTVVSEPAENAARLQVQSSSGRRVLSIGPDGKAREYEIYATATFSVSTPDGSFELSQQEISLKRDMYFDPLEALAASEEQALLQQDMEKRVATLIIDRISAAYTDVESPATESRTSHND
jgi:LPS-assembly lipoprotein